MTERKIRAVATHSTPLGDMCSRWTELGLWQLDWETSPPPVGNAPDFQSQIESLDQLLKQYFKSGDTGFDEIVIDPAGWTPFASRVYEQCRKIPAGETRTYRDLATAVDRVDASRAVGAAMARNRVLLIIPCHRVVSSNGELRGFSAPGGLTTKRSLLDLERSGVWPTDLFATQAS